jgi:hypothetical protein
MLTRSKLMFARAKLGGACMLACVDADVDHRCQLCDTQLRQV